MSVSVLVVEDDAELGEIYCELLEYSGMQVRHVTDGQQALDALAEEVPDVLMLDMHLPRVSGLEILRHVRADVRLKNSKVIVITADALLSGVVKEEADYVLIKPFDYEHLRTLLDRISVAE